MQVHMASGRLGARRAEGELLIETREQIITKNLIRFTSFLFQKFLHTSFWSKM